MTDQSSPNHQDRRPNEPDKWYQRFLYYLELGPRRAQARQLVPEAIETLKLTMRGELRDPDGSLTAGMNCTQRRLAAEKILEIAGLSAPQPEEPEAEGQDRAAIREIRIIDPHSPEGIEHARRVRARAKARAQNQEYDDSPPEQKKRYWFSDS